MKVAIGFVLGATAGSLVTWKLLDKKYKDLANKEIEEIREYYRGKLEPVGTMKNADVDYVVDKTEKEEYEEIIDDSNYTVQIDQGEELIEPYTISPEEYGEMPGYDTKSWVLYSDDTLTNEIGEIVYEPENIIGDALTRFGEYEDDSVYVRNENEECDYEILLHDKTFDEIKMTNSNRID